MDGRRIKQIEHGDAWVSGAMNKFSDNSDALTFFIHLVEITNHFVEQPGELCNFVPKSCPAYAGNVANSHGLMACQRVSFRHGRRVSS